MLSGPNGMGIGVEKGALCKECSLEENEDLRSKKGCVHLGQAIFYRGNEKVGRRPEQSGNTKKENPKPNGTHRKKTPHPL